MQPYRVLIQTYKDQLVMSAMMSVDKDGGHHIYIVEKHQPHLKGYVPGQLSFFDDDPDIKKIAHDVTTKVNSIIKYSYTCAYGDDQPRHRRWWVWSKDNRNISAEYTLQDCLKSAMQDYCSRKRYKIIQEL